MKEHPSLFYTKAHTIVLLVCLFLAFIASTCTPEATLSPQRADTKAIEQTTEQFMEADKFQKQTDYTKAIDAYKAYLELTAEITDTTIQIALIEQTNNALVQLMNCYQSLGEQDECVACFDSLMQHPSPIVRNYTLRDLYAASAYAISRTEDMNRAEQLMDKALSMPIIKGTPLRLFRNYTYAAAVFFSNPERQEEVIYYAKSGLEQAQLAKTEKETSFLRTLLGLQYKRKGNVYEAIQLFTESIEEAHRTHNLLSEVNSLNSLCELLISWQLYEPAKLFIDQAVEQIQQIEQKGDQINPSIFGLTYLYKGQVMAALQQPDSALQAYQKADSYVHDIPYNMGISDLDIAYGKLMIDYPGRIPQGKEGLERAAQEGTAIISATAHFYLAQLALQTGNIAESEQHIDQAYTIAHQRESTHYFTADYYNIALQLALEKGDPQRIRQYAKEYQEAMATYQNKQSTRKLAKLISDYYLSEEALHMQLLQSEMHSKQLRWILAFSGCLLLLLLILIFYIYTIRLYRVRQEMADKRYAALLNELGDIRSNLAQSRLQATRFYQELESSRNEYQQALSDLLNPEQRNLRREGDLRNAFQRVHPNFLNNLRRKVPNITPREEFACLLIALHQTSNQVSELMNISLRSVNTMRYRIRAKLRPDANTSLEEAIQQLL